MSDMNRREALTLIALAPFAPAATRADAQGSPLGAATAPEGAAPAQAPLFFTLAEMITVGVLADLIIPADERSGSATDAGVPEFIDFMMTDTRDASLPVRIRGGLAWINAESRRRFGHDFAEATAEEQNAILDDIAFPLTARPEMSQGVAFFNRFRDLVASGFWSSEMGVRDLQYIGNIPVVRWEGCSAEALRKLQVE
jgi:gluconate 2-dehydrogenase gamma chain